MDPLLLAAILNFATKFGIDAAIAFFESKSATLDDAIAALKKAKEKSLQDYINEAK